MELVNNTLHYCHGDSYEEKHHSLLHAKKNIQTMLQNLQTCHVTP